MFTRTSDKFAVFIPNPLAGLGRAHAHIAAPAHSVNDAKTSPPVELFETYWAVIDYVDLAYRSLSLFCIATKPIWAALSTQFHYNQEGLFMGIIGSEIKPFTATAFQAGKDFFDVTDEDVRGKWAVFFFYPADFTFVCPTELEDLGEHYEMLQKLDVEVYGVSTDTHFSHKAWHDTSDKISKLNFPFLGDQNHVLARNFDVLREGVGLADRATFVVDPDGVIQLVEQTCEGVGRNANELVRKIRAAQYVRNNPGQVCPAAWEEGEDTLAPSLDLVGKI